MLHKCTKTDSVCAWECKCIHISKEIKALYSKIFEIDLLTPEHRYRDITVSQHNVDKMQYEQHGIDVFIDHSETN